MSDYSDYFVWLAEGDWIRVSARAIIFSQTRDQLLIERNTGIQNKFSNFIGGGVEVGETLQSCIERELNEETNARIIHSEYLFVVENFISHESEVRHSLEHYFEIDLDRDDVVPTHRGIEYVWCTINELDAVDLRREVVRNSIMTGTYRHVSHLNLGDR